MNIEYFKKIIVIEIVEIFFIVITRNAILCFYILFINLKVLFFHIMNFYQSYFMKNDINVKALLNMLNLFKTHRMFFTRSSKKQKLCIFV